jgi:glycerophosphoryl diester phosphodiesterase
VLVSHDVYLSRVSNVADFPEFAERKKERTYQGKILNDWWVSDFTVPELKRLGVK